MATLIKTLVLLVFVSTTIGSNMKPYSIPVPKFTVKEPKGYTITIPHVQGINEVAFSITLNKPTPTLGVQNKSYAKHVGDVWIVEDDKIQLKVGDTMFYWVFVEINKYGYRRDDLSYSVTESSFKTTPTKAPPITPDYIEKPTINIDNVDKEDLNKIQECCNGNTKYMTKITTQLNVTLMQLKSLHDIIAPLEKKIDSLTSVLTVFLENSNIGTKLLYTGDSPPNQLSTLSAIRSIIDEKLNLPHLTSAILDATRTRDGIVFTVNSATTKAEILSEAKKYLKGSKHNIVNYQENTSNEPSRNCPNCNCPLAPVTEMPSSRPKPTVAVQLEVLSEEFSFPTEESSKSTYDKIKSTPPTYDLDPRFGREDLTK